VVVVVAVVVAVVVGIDAVVVVGMWEEMSVH